MGGHSRYVLCNVPLPLGPDNCILDYVFKSQQAGSFLSVVPPFGTRVSPASLLKGKKVYLADSFRRDSPDGSRQYKTCASCLNCALDASHPKPLSPASSISVSTSAEACKFSNQKVPILLWLVRRLRTSATIQTVGPYFSFPRLLS